VTDATPDTPATPSIAAPFSTTVIEGLIPHRGPARLVQTILEDPRPDVLVCGGRIPADSAFVASGRAPAVVLLELAAQAAAVQQAMAAPAGGTPAKPGYLVAIRAASLSADDVVPRVKRRAFILGAIGAVAAFAWGARPGLSLTICAAVVISSFLALEKLIGRVGPGRDGRLERRKLIPLILVTVSSFVLLGLVLWKWKGFVPVAGAAGLSVVVLAIVPEVWARR